ncbi:MAG TPA: hypothetical protein VGC08_05440 [Pedobacter sp.]
MATLNATVNSENWIETIKNSGFSLSEVEKFIDESYKSGYDAKDEEIRSRMMNIFTTNIILTNQITEDLLVYLEELNIHPLSAYLKIDSIVSFHIIFTVKLNDYISEELLKAYDWISDTEKKVRNTNYNIDLSFMHEDENLNMESLNPDGFRFKHKRLLKVKTDE